MTRYSTYHTRPLARLRRVFPPNPRHPQGPKQRKCLFIAKAFLLKLLGEGLHCAETYVLSSVPEAGGLLRM